MNRVYKVIWSKAKHCYVVTSEIAKSHTKGESTGRGLKKLAAALLVAAALMGPNFAWAADPTVKVNDASGVEQTVYTKDGADVIFATKTDLDAKANADKDGKVTAASGKIGNVDITSDGALTGVRSLGVENINAGGTITGNKLTDGVASLQAGNLNTTGNINAHDINAHDIVATGDISGKAISGTTITGTSLNTQGGDISGGDITATGLNTKGGEINGGDIKSSGTIHADGKITGNGLDAGSGAINGGSLSVTGTMEGNSLTLKGGDLDAGSGTITTTGDINGNNINANGKITTTSLEVTGGLKTDHITLGSETNNYTDINKGNVTSEVDEKVSGVEYTAESIFNKDGSSITARADVGGPADSTGKSIVGAKEISQYLGDAALPDDSKKNVTRSMVRNGDTFYMEDKAVEGTKSSTVSQNAGERKVTVAEGTNTLTVTENLTGGIVSETKGDDGTVTLTQGMDGTYKVETSGNSTEVIGGQKIENYNGGLDTNITGNETHHVTKNQTITVTGKSSLSAADIENKASSSIWNHVGEGYNTSWKMTDGKISESIVNGTASNKENTTVDGTKRIITNDTDKVTGTYNQTATSNNISLKNAAGDTSFTKSESLLKGEKTSVTNPNGSSTINQSAESIVNFVKNSKGHTTRTEQSAEDITNTAKNGTITNDAKDVLNKGTNSVINEVGANQVAVKTDSVKAAYGSDTYTTWDDKGITSNTSGNMSNTVGGDLINTVTGDSSLSATNIKNKASTSITSQIGEDGKVKSEMNAEGISNTAEDGTITNDAKTVKTITGNNTVTSKTEGTTFVNTGANAALKKGKEQGSRTETRIFGNQVETGKVETDFADVNNNLTVGGSTTLGRDENTTLTVNSKSTFKDTVKMDKTLEVDGESTFNNKVTITKGGLDVKGGTTTDSLKVTGTSEFGGKAAFKDDVSMDKKLTVKGAAEFKDDVSMGKNLTVTGKTETGILHVNGDGYVGGNLNVEGNIETHDAVLSADSRQVVTGRQLYQTNERVDRLDNRIKKVGANAAALAALRPGDFNPDDKFSIAAGFGSYRNANAAALGLFYRPNENVLLSLGTSFGDGENMVNAGVSVKFGRGKSMAERRKEMADEVSSMRDEMRSQDERIAELEEMLKKQSELIEKLSKES